MATSRFLRVWSLALGLTCVLCGPALAHPHGVMQCSLAVTFEDGRPTLLSGRLLMDAAHSREMQTMLRDPVTGRLDAQRQQRFMFSLKMQLARSNWLLGAEVEGVVASLAPAGEPMLVLTEDASVEGRVGVDVKLRIESAPVMPSGGGADAPSAAAWQFSCADPTFYWVTEFITPSAPLAVVGCATPVHSMPVAVATGARAGSVQVNMRCAR